MPYEHRVYGETIEIDDTPLAHIAIFAGKRICSIRDLHDSIPISNAKSNDSPRSKLTRYHTSVSWSLCNTV